jgi:hypothetical protein
MTSSEARQRRPPFLQQLGPALGWVVSQPGAAWSRIRHRWKYLLSRVEMLPAVGPLLWWFLTLLSIPVVAIGWWLTVSVMCIGFGLSVMVLLALAVAPFRLVYLGAGGSTPGWIAVAAVGLAIYTALAWHDRTVGRLRRLESELGEARRQRDRLARDAGAEPLN